MPGGKKRVAHGKNARQLFCERVPDLNLANQMTISKAIHPIDIVAPIRLWSDFEMQVRLATINTNFGNVILGHHPAGFLNANHTINELYACSDEGDVQGRFNNNVSKIMTAVFQSEGIMCKLSSGRSTTTDCGGVPDIVLTRIGGTQALLVGEFKTPWVHDLTAKVMDPVARPRLLGMLFDHIYD